MRLKQDCLHPEEVCSRLEEVCSCLEEKDLCPEEECSCFEGKYLHLQKEHASPRAGCARFAFLFLSGRHCYYTISCRTNVKQRPADSPLKTLQAYIRQSTAASTIMSKSFGNFRRHFLKINFQYNVRFLTLTATYISIVQ